MNILLIKLPESLKKFDLTGPSKKLISGFPPLGLQYIGASLEHDDNNVEILDLEAEIITKEQLKNLLKKSDAVGISVYFNNSPVAIDIAREIKEIDPEIPIIIGGPYCTFLKEKSLKQIPFADISVELEGELVILELVRFFKGMKKLSDIHGIFYRENNQIKSGKPLQVIKDLNNLQFPARHLTEKYEYGNFSGIRPRKKFSSMITSRGCPFHCRFCTRFGKIKGWSFRKRSSENIIKEMVEIHEKYNSTMIVDDTFLADKKAAYNIMEKLIELDLNLELYILGARVDTAEPELYKKMKRAGVKYLSFGIESGNQDVLDFYNKKIKLQQIRKAVHFARKMDFITQGFVIFGAPFETEKHIENTMKFVNSLPLDIVVFQSLMYEIGSDIWEEAVKNKIISKNDISVKTDSRLGLGNFTQEELNKYIKKAYRRFYLNPLYLGRLLHGTFQNKNIDHIKTMTRFMFSPEWSRII